MAVCVSVAILAIRVMKFLRSLLSLTIFFRSMPLNMTWCSVPGASNLAPLGMASSPFPRCLFFSNMFYLSMRSQVQSSRFPLGRRALWAGGRVIFLSVRRTQTRILLTLLMCRHLFGVPACALTPICFLNPALNSPTNLFFPYILRSRMAGGFAVNSEPLNP